MDETPVNTDKSELTYRIRIMGGIVIAELLFLALIHFWPVSELRNDQDIYQADEEIAIQAPVRTRQQSAPPPPPSPPVPVPIPNDEPVEEIDIEFPEDIFSESFDSLSVTAGEGGEGDNAIAGNPQIGPSVVRIEEPTFKNESPEKADIYVSFLVDKQGNVEEATIEKIFLYDDDGRPTLRVDQIDEEILQKTIKAALNWKFRPAKDKGKPVRAYKTGIFTVDY